MNTAQHKIVPRVPGPVGMDEEQLAAEMQADYERMTEFYETVRFIEPVEDWRKRPELGEEADDDDLDDLPSYTGLKQLVKADYSKIERDLDTLEDKARVQLLEVLKEMRDATANKIKKANNLQGFAADLKLPYFGEFRNTLRELMHQAHQTGSRNAQDDLRETQTFASSFTPRGALKWLRDKEIVVSGIFSDGLTGAIKNLLVNALKTGIFGDALINSMYELFEPYLGNPDILKDGVPPEPYKLNTMVRTITTEAYNHGRLTEYLDPAMRDFLVGVRYSAILDSRTTEVCRFLDGRVFKVDDPDLPGLIPPNHFNCRSILVPVVVGEKVEASEFITPAQKGKAKGLADAKFLEQEG